MVTLNERIKELRNHFELSQKDFAQKIGVSQRSVSWSEQPGNNVPDSTIKTICLVFSINEEWMRYGTLPMFIQPASFNLDSFIEEKNGTNLEKEIIKAYFEIDCKTRNMLIQHFKNCLTEESIAVNNTFASDIPDDPEEFEKLFPPIELGESSIG